MASPAVRASRRSAAAVTSLERSLQEVWATRRSPRAPLRRYRSRRRCRRRDRRPCTGSAEMSCSINILATSLSEVSESTVMTSFVINSSTVVDTGNGCLRTRPERTRATSSVERTPSGRSLIGSTAIRCEVPCSAINWAARSTVSVGRDRQHLGGGATACAPSLDVLGGGKWRSGRGPRSGPRRGDYRRRRSLRP